MYILGVSNHCGAQLRTPGLTREPKSELQIFENLKVSCYVGSKRVVARHVLTMVRASHLYGRPEVSFSNHYLCYDDPTSSLRNIEGIILID